MLCCSTGFVAQVAATPGAVALVFEGQSLTYVEFASRVNRLARYLISVGVGPESLVALAMRRSVDLVVGMYAVVAAGGAYVPLDPDHPVERNGHILGTCVTGVCVLSTADDGVVLPGEFDVVLIDELDVSGFSDVPVSDADRVAPLRGSNAAYVIFTSGSDGEAEGCGGFACGDRQSDGVDAGSICSDRGGCVSAEDCDDVRRVVVGLLLAVGGGCAVGGGHA